MSSASSAERRAEASKSAKQTLMMGVSREGHAAIPMHVEVTRFSNWSTIQVVDDPESTVTELQAKEESLI